MKTQPKEPTFSVTDNRRRYRWDGQYWVAANMPANQYELTRIMRNRVDAMRDNRYLN